MSLISASGDGELIDVAGVGHLFKLTGAQSAGALAVEEFTLAGSAMGARPHIHDRHDEHFYVLSGQLTVHDGVAETTIGPGALVSALRGDAHGFRNASTAPVRGLCLFTPAGYENYFRDVHAALAAGEPFSEQLLTAHRARFGTRPA